MDGTETFISHLIELRDRLLKAAIAWIVLFIALFPFANDLYTLLAAPIRARLPADASMIATQIATPFLTPFKLAMIAAVFVAMPYILYQLWAFVAPGLYRHEKRLALPLLLSSVLLFYVGMAFAYLVVFPLIFAFFAATVPDGVQQMPDIAAYLDFILTLFFAFGVAFEVPIAVILLVAIGVTTPAALVQKRPYVIVGAFVIGMLLTPPDVFSQTLLAVPMWLLYELGIAFARLFVRHRTEDKDDHEGPASSGVPVATPPVPVGSEIAAGTLDEPGRYRPLDDDELEAELDRLDAEEAVAAWLRQAHELRAAGEVMGARQLLYRVLEQGSAEQRRVARAILVDLDT